MLLIGHCGIVAPYTAPTTTDTTFNHTTRDWTNKYSLLPKTYFQCLPAKPPGTRAHDCLPTLFDTLIWPTLTRPVSNPTRKDLLSMSPQIGRACQPVYHFELDWECLIEQLLKPLELFMSPIKRTSHRLSMEWIGSYYLVSRHVDTLNRRSPAEHCGHQGGSSLFVCWASGRDGHRWTPTCSRLWPHEHHIIQSLTRSRNLAGLLTMMGSRIV